MEKLQRLRLFYVDIIPPPLHIKRPRQWLCTPCVENRSTWYLFLPLLTIPSSAAGCCGGKIKILRGIFFLFPVLSFLLVSREIGNAKPSVQFLSIWKDLLQIRKLKEMKKIVLTKTVKYTHQFLENRYFWGILQLKEKKSTSTTAQEKWT